MVGGCNRPLFIIVTIFLQVKSVSHGDESDDMYTQLILPTRKQNEVDETAIASEQLNFLSMFSCNVVMATQKMPHYFTDCQCRINIQSYLPMRSLLLSSHLC